MILSTPPFSVKRPFVSSICDANSGYKANKSKINLLLFAKSLYLKELNIIFQQKLMEMKKILTPIRFTKKASTKSRKKSARKP